MVKTKSCFVCLSCGNTEPKWVGRCTRCGEWNSYQEEEVSRKHREKKPTEGEPKKICDVSQEAYERVATGVKEFDRVVGGGLVKGSLLLVGGEPGIGKSTLLMEVCGKLGELFPGEKILYVSGEESEGQVADRSRRLGVEGGNLYVFNESSWERIKENLQKLKAKILCS